MRPWFRTTVQVLLAGFGLLLGLVVLVGDDVTSDERLGMLLIAGLAIAGSALWRMASRNSAEPDLVDGTVLLGDGRQAEGQRVTMPRSKRFALGAGSVLFAMVSGWMAVTAADEIVLQVIGWGGVLLFTFAGAAHLRRAREEQWLGFSPAGVTLRATGGHFTVPWDAVHTVGVHEMSHRGVTSRYVAIDFDVEDAVGQVSRTVRVGSRAKLGMPALLLPSAMFDLSVDDVVDVAHRWQQEPVWPDSP